MTVLLSWNIQYGKGCDGRIDLARIAGVARSRGPVDVLCLQEVAINYAEMGGGETVDQTAELAALFPGYAPVFGAGVDAHGPLGRRRFGNLILSRLPILDAATHPLPRPAEPGIIHMPRAALVCLIGAPSAAPLRVMTTHLEFHSENQRLAQTARLRAIHAEAAANDRAPPAPGPGPYATLPAPSGTAMCGDFNFEVASEPYRAALAPFPDGTPALVDAWTARHGARPHDPTCGIFDRAQWKQGAHARDFWFVSSDLASSIVDVAVDTATDASDHQPVWLTLA
ncbi:MAG: endonuclease/exonuclease/phosphatase family protein [Alphaproteobacteria bacterium]|nr:endonuclease/exonuclease/phosphatase family protein [Alphaproteobacteria bacterium]